MTAKEQLLQELEQTSEEVIEVTLAFLRSVKAQRQETVTLQEPETNPLRDCKLKCVKGQKLRSNELLNQRHEYYDLSTRTA